MGTELNKIRHERSVRDFPNLKLEDDEYVEMVFRRSIMVIIGIWLAVLASILVVSVAVAIFQNVLSVPDLFMANDNTLNFMTMLMWILHLTIIVIGIVITYVSTKNCLYVTNQRAIQITATSLTSSSTNMIDLSGIEDVSFKQDGLVQQLAHIGTLRMSTVGDETTYTFLYTDEPGGEVMKKLTGLVRKAKSKEKSEKE